MSEPIVTGQGHYTRAQALLHELDTEGSSMVTSDVIVNALLAIGHALLAEAAPRYGVHLSPMAPRPAKPETLAANEAFPIADLGEH